MESITIFIEEKLKLKVNKKKSTMDGSWERKFLGFSFYLYLLLDFNKILN